MTTHGPTLPLWTCAGCSLPWPCATRRRELLAHYQNTPASLTLYMRSCFVAAAQDMGWATAGSLHRRFLGWLP